MRAKREGALLPFDKNVRCIFSRDDSERDEAELSEIDSEKQMFPYIQENRRDGEVHFIDVAGNQKLANDRHAATDSDVLVLGRFSRFPERRVQSVGDEVEGGATLHHKGRPRMMCEHKYGRVVRRSVAPPAYPCVVLPRTANGPKHISSQYPGTDVFERLSGNRVVDAVATAAVLTMHLLEDFGFEEPVVQLQSSHAQRVLQVLAGSGTETVNRNRKRRDFDFAHGVVLRSFSFQTALGLCVILYLSLWMLMQRSGSPQPKS